MQSICIRKAEPIGNQEIPDIQIVIAGSLPDFSDLGSYEDFYRAQARELFRCLCFLPGGTFDQLLLLMIESRASLFKVPLFKEE